MKYLLLGYGLANKSVEKFFIQNNIDYLIYDDNIPEYQTKINLNEIDIIVKSSGISNQNTLIKEALSRGILIYSDLELFYQFFPHRKYITVTGSNGKTTTVSLLKKIFEKSQREINLGGNIGIPVFEFASNNNDLIIEASSFMLEYTNFYHPKIACLLNISFAHLDHHETLTNYKMAKKKLFQNLNEKDYLIFNADDPEVGSIITDIKAIKIPFSNKRRVDGAYLIKNHLYYKEQYITSKDNIKIIGEHNIQNILACICMALIENISIENIKTAIEEFNGIPHRIEYIGQFKGLRVYNDSKSTNLFALKNALNCFREEKIILISGGKFREDNFMIFQEGYNQITTLLLYGDNKDIFYTNFKDKVKRTYLFDTLEEVVEFLKTMDLTEDVILFSPGSSSQDQFKNFEERGRKFKNYML